MADFEREVNNLAATARLRSLLEGGSQVRIHGGSVEGREISPWMRRAMGAVALSVAGAASAAAPMTAPAGHAKELVDAMQLTPVQVVVSGKAYEAPHPMERVRLCKEIASEQRLNAHGFDWRDLYAIVQAETGWASREGKGLNGKPSFGLAQLEKATAESLGVDPHDAKQAIVGVAKLIKEASAWARARGVADKRAAISVYYNLSTKARNAWDGETIDTLPTPTQNHIRNLRDGHKIATSLAPRYEKFAIKARQALHAQAAIRADLEQQRAHLASLPPIGFGAAAVDGMPPAAAKARVIDLLAGQVQARREEVRVSADGSMSVQMRMQGFPGSALRPSEDMARRTLNQARRELQDQGLGRLADSLAYLGRVASDVVASARNRLGSQPLATAKNVFSAEFQTLARALTGGDATLAGQRTSQQLADSQPDGRVLERSMAANLRLAQGGDGVRMIKDATVAASAPQALREQQLRLAEAVQRLAAQATSKGVQYALNEQGRMIAAAAGGQGQRLVHG